MTQTRYTLDDFNRLVAGEASGVTGRQLGARVMEGRVTTDRQGRLVYYVETPAMDSGPAGPRTVRLDGTWKLTANHELALALHETGARQRRTLYLRGAIVGAQADRLVFALRRHGGDEATAQQVILRGRWRADAKNRLSFLVEKGRGLEDRLTLQSGWQIGPRHELRYRYRQRVPGHRRDEEHLVALEGSWDITQADRLVYRLAGSPAGALEFTARLRSPSLIARQGRIVYDIGVGVSGGKLEPRRVTLSGAWKLRRDLSIAFEVPYAGGRVQAIRFEGTYALTPMNQVIVALSNRWRQPLGLTVTFTRELSRRARLFLRVHRSPQETSAIGGVQVRF